MSGSPSRVVAACCGLVCLLGGRAFILASQVRRQQLDGPQLNLRGRSPWAAATASPHRGLMADSSSARLCLAFGALAGCGIVAAQGRSASTARRVSVEEILNLSVDSMPPHWRTKVSMTMARRNEVVQAIERQLKDSFFVLAFNRLGMENDIQKAKELFPKGVEIRSLKNTIFRKATIGSTWEAFADNLVGANVYVFVKDDQDLKPTINAYLKMEKQFRRVSKLAEIAENTKGLKYQLRPLVGGALAGESSFITPENVAKLKDFPTKLELIAQIAGAVKQVPQRLAVSTRQVTQKIAIGTKKIVEKLEEQGKSRVGDLAA